MIYCGSRHKLISYRVPFKGQEKIDFALFQDEYGKGVSCQICDTNDTKNAKYRNSYFQLKIYTDVDLRIGDEVEIKNIRYIEKYGNRTVIAVDINEDPYNPLKHLDDEETGF